MTGEALLALLPLAALGGGAVAAMLAAALAPKTATGWAALAHALAALLLLLRLDAPAAPSALLADDGLARAGVLVASLVGLFVLALPRPAREAPALVTLASAGTAAAAAATHAASLILALETVTLATVALAAARRDRPAIEAAIKLMVPAGAAAAAMFLGFALAFAATASLELSGMGAPGRLGQVAAALLLFGLLFKFAIVPMHMWAPDLFEGAPAQAVAVAGVLSKAAVALVLLRLSGGLQELAWWSNLLAMLGAVSFLLGSLIALRQLDLRRLLGWSSVAQSGLLAMLIGLGRGEGVALALLFALLAYAPALLAALAAAEAPDPATAQEHPLARAALFLGLVSLAGLPAAGGFVAKLLVLKELTIVSAWGAVAVVIIGSGLGFVAYFRFVQRHVADGAGQGGATGAGGSRITSGLLLAASGLILVIGMAPEPLAALLSRFAPALS